MPLRCVSNKRGLCKGGCPHCSVSVDDCSALAALYRQDRYDKINASSAFAVFLSQFRVRGGAAARMLDKRGVLY